MKKARILFGLITLVCVLAYAYNHTQDSSAQTDVLEMSDTTAQAPTITQRPAGLDTFEIESLSLPKNLLTERKSSEQFEFMESEFFPYGGKIEATCQLPSHLVSGGQNAFLNSLFHQISFGHSFLKDSHATSLLTRSNTEINWSLLTTR